MPIAAVHTATTFEEDFGSQTTVCSVRTPVTPGKN